MGYTNAPAEFARANQKCLQTEIFMDDAICGGRDLADLLRETNELLAYMKKYGLPTNPEKCHFGVVEVKYLGYLLVNGGRTVSTQSVEKIRQQLKQALLYPVRKSQSGTQTYEQQKTIIQKVLGVLNFVRKWVHNYSARTKFLTDLTKKANEDKREFTQEMVQKTKAIVDDLSNSGHIAGVDGTAATMVYLDASVGTGSKEKDSRNIREKASAEEILYGFTELFLRKNLT